MRARSPAPGATCRAGALPQTLCLQGASRVLAVFTDAVRHLLSHPAHSGRVTALPGSANAQCYPLCLFPQLRKALQDALHLCELRSQQPNAANLSKMPCISPSFAPRKPVPAAQSSPRCLASLRASLCYALPWSCSGVLQDYSESCALLLVPPHSSCLRPCLRPSV